MSDENKPTFKEFYYTLPSAAEEVMVRTDDPDYLRVDSYIDRRTPVRFKKLHPDAVTPSYSKPGDAGLDLTAISKEYHEDLDLIVMGTGLAFEIPENHVGLIFPRSSICKTPLMLSNSVGVLDSGYRGEVKFMFRPLDRPRKNYEIGDRVGQLIIMPYPQISLEEVEDLSTTERGQGGFGSTGK